MPLTKANGPANFLTYHYEYTNAAQRTGDTGFVATDVGKIARQLDDNSYWTLTNHNPVTWAANSGTASGGAGGVLSGSYPNPGFAVDMATQAELDTVAAAKENSLGNPTTNGYLLSSTTAGVRSWIAPSSGGMTDPMTTAGDLIRRNASNVTDRLGVGTNGQVLTVVSGLPAWAAASGGGATTHPALRFQLDAQSGITMDGSNNVSIWADQSGRNNDFIMAPGQTSNTRPLYVASGINAQPSVRFDGVDDSLQLAINAGFLPRLTMACVVRPLAADTDEGIFSWAASLTNGTPNVIFQRSGTNTRWYIAGGYQFLVAHPTNTARIYVMTWDGYTWRLWVDGTAQTPYNAGNTNSGTTFFLGNGFNGYANVEFGAIRVYDTAISDTVRDALETEWGTRYGITVA